MIAVFIPVPRHRLAGKLLMPDGDRRPGLLFVHGWGATQRQDIGKAKRLTTLGYACLTFNLTGHAHTRRHVETVTRADNLADVRAAYDFLAGQPSVDADRIGVIGASYGGYLAVLLTAERKVRWLALHAPAIYKDEDFDRPKRSLNLDPDLPAFRRRTLAPDDNRALDSASRFVGDVVIVESERDDVIPARVVANYVGAFSSAASVRHEVIRGADHALSSPRARARHIAILYGWFARHAVSS